MTAILLGFIVLVLCLFIFFIIFCRKENEEEVRQFRAHHSKQGTVICSQENGTKLYFPQSTFDKKQRSNFATRDSSRIFDQRSSYNSPAESGPGPQRAQQRNQNNYDEYDINGYRKDRRDWRDVKSNNYVSREEEERAEKKTSNATGKKPEWRNVYGKGTSQPADGAVNAFQWSE